MRKTKFKRSEISLWELGKFMELIIYSQELLHQLEAKKIKVSDEWEKYCLPRFKDGLEKRQKSIMKKIEESLEDRFKN
jgi:hypothetical protein